MSPTSGSEAITYYAGHDNGLVDTQTWRTVANSAAYLQNCLTPDMKILDVGCGPGSITIDLARRTPEGHTTGLDSVSATSVLQRARTDAARQNVSNVDFVTGDALALPFPDATFDLTRSHQLLQHVTDPGQALCEMRRVTKPGGIVACRVAEMQHMIVYPPDTDMSALPMVFARVVDDAEPKRDQEVGRKLHVLAREAEFRPGDVHTSSSNWTFRTSEERLHWTTQMISIATDSAFSRAVVQKGYATQEELKTMREAWQKWAENEDGVAVLMHFEMLCKA